MIWGQEDEKKPAKDTEETASEAEGKAREGGVLAASGGECFKEQVTNWVQESWGGQVSSELRINNWQ